MSGGGGGGGGLITRRVSYYQTDGLIYITWVDSTVFTFRLYILVFTYDISTYNSNFSN